MGATSYLANVRRLAKANFPEPSPNPVVPPGCRGAACPAFALCQGRCASRTGEPTVAPDGGVLIQAIA